MRVLHVSTSDVRGGASVAAYRIHKCVGLRDEINSRMLVRDKFSKDESVAHIGRLRQARAVIATKIGRSLIRLVSREKQYESLGIFGCGLSDVINGMDVDIVQIHWVQGEMLSLRDFKRIKAPKLLTLHDMWPMCGLGHYDEPTGKYKYWLKQFLEEYLLESKRIQVWENCWIHFTTEWMRKEAERRGFPVERSVVVPYPGKTEDFYFEEDNDTGSSSGVTKLLFGAQGGIHDKRKGFDLLDGALQMLVRKGYKVELTVFGCEMPEGFTRSYKVSFCGSIESERVLRSIYRGSDLMIVPSTMEAFGQTASESMLCGTPVLCFTDTGTGSLIEDGINGFSCSSKTSEGLADVLGEILEDRNGLHAMRKLCAKSAKSRWSEIVMSTIYLDVYQRIVSEERKKKVG